MRLVLCLLLSLTAAAFPARWCKAFPLVVGGGIGFLAPAGDFGQDIKGGASPSFGFGLFPIDRLKIGLQFSYASLKGRGDENLVQELFNGELFGRYSLLSITEGVEFYAQLGVGNSRIRRTLGSGEEKGYQVSGALGGGAEFRIVGRTAMDAGILWRRYFSKKPGDAFLLNMGLWYGL